MSIYIQDNGRGNNNQVGYTTTHVIVLRQELGKRLHNATIFDNGKIHHGEIIRGRDPSHPKIRKRSSGPHIKVRQL